MTLSTGVEGCSAVWDRVIEWTYPEPDKVFDEKLEVVQ